jgi:hypothetical protein
MNPSNPAPSADVPAGNAHAPAAADELSRGSGASHALTPDASASARDVLHSATPLSFVVAPAPLGVLWVVWKLVTPGV